MCKKLAPFLTLCALIGVGSLSISSVRAHTIADLSTHRIAVAKQLHIVEKAPSDFLSGIGSLFKFGRLLMDN